MFGLDSAVTSAISTTIGKIIDKVFPDPQAAAQAKALLMSAEAQAEIQRTQTELSAIIAEANSQDPWTSRARPTFLYVMYAMILISLPFAILWAFEPVIADRMSIGLSKWLNAIPESLWTLFGVGYLGYTGARTFDKWRGTTPTK